MGLPELLEENHQASNRRKLALAYPRANKPHETLAALIKNRLGISIPSDMLRKFITTEWHRLEILGHAIHQAPSEESPND
jgi:hypothetical protein